MKTNLPIFAKGTINPEFCFGCTACEQSCKHEAIAMKLDQEGFLYPVVNEQNCTECGLCIRACPMIDVLPQDQEKPLRVLAAWIEDPTKRAQATSGGIFLAIATEVIQRGGVVFGVAYDAKWNLYHSMAENLEECQKFTGSKYAQSDPRNTFSEVRKLLKSGTLVYYTGTPCQIGGLRRFLRKDYQKLITSDNICHGTPSNNLFKREISWREKQKGDKIKSFSYRNKDRFGWGYDAKIEWLKSGTEYDDAWESPYFSGFWKNNTLRPSCYRCNFASIKRQGDITLGDFWGVKKQVKEIKKTGKGVSLLLINSQKGVDLFAALKNVAFFESDISVALKTQAHLSRPVNHPESREGIYDQAYEGDFASFAKTKLLFGRKAKMQRQVRNWGKRALLWKHWK